MIQNHYYKAIQEAFMDLTSSWESPDGTKSTSKQYSWPLMAKASVLIGH